MTLYSVSKYMILVTAGLNTFQTSSKLWSKESSNVWFKTVLCHEAYALVVWFYGTILCLDQVVIMFLKLPLLHRTECRDHQLFGMVIELTFSKISAKHLEMQVALCGVILPLMSVILMTSFISSSVGVIPPISITALSSFIQIVPSLLVSQSSNAFFRVCSSSWWAWK